MRKKGNIQLKMDLIFRAFIFFNYFLFSMIGLTIGMAMFFFILSSKSPFYFSHLFSEKFFIVYKFMYFGRTDFEISSIFLVLSFISFYSNYISLYRPAKKNKSFFGISHLKNKSLMKSIIKDVCPELVLNAFLLALFFDGIGFQLHGKEINLERSIIVFILAAIIFIPYNFEWSFQSRVQNKAPKGLTYLLVRLFKKDKSS